MKRTAQFLFEVGMLKKTPRTGYQFLGSGGESVADHSFRTAVIGFAIASMVTDCDRNQVVLMCLFHDLAEARTGDHNYVNKRYVKKDENRVMEDQLSGLEFKDEIKGILQEYEACHSLESHLAKDADQLDLILELKQQMDLGNPNAIEWIGYAVKRLSTSVAKSLAEKILNTHSAEWWFNKDTDWWVNGGTQPSKGG